MKTRRPPSLLRILLAASLALASAAHAAGDKDAYKKAKAEAATAYDRQHRECDGEQTRNAKKVCLLQSEADLARAREGAEVAYQDTDRARATAARRIAEADYKVAKQKCNDQPADARDGCAKQARTAFEQARTAPVGKQ